MNIFRKCGAFLASLALIGMPISATAQTANTPQPAIQTVGQDSGIWAERAGVVKIAEGVWVTSTEEQMLQQYGCTVGPPGLVREFLSEMAEDGHDPCSPKWYAGLSKVNKKGTQLSLIKRSFAGYLVAESDKGINLTPNYGEWKTYSFDSRSIGRPVTVANTTAPSGAMVTADLFKTAVGATLNGTGAALVGGLMNPCRGKGGCGDTWNIQGGTAAALSATQTEVNTSANIDAVIQGGTGPCSTCTPSGHTQDGPGSAPYTGGGG